jgi:hypothetical protein
VAADLHEPDPTSGDRDSLCDTLTGFDPGLDDRLMRALDDADKALDDALERLRKRSDRPPPPPLPPAPSAALAA